MYTLSFVSQKGGVGKTTVAAATALRSAELGYKTLVASTDIAHSLADSFDIPLDDKPKEIAPNLWAQEISVVADIHNYWDVLQSFVSGIISVGGVDRIVAETADRFQAELQGKGIRLDMDLKAEGTSLEMHPGEIQQVLQNLVHNAIQAQPGGGRIRIASRELEGGVMIQVADEVTGATTPSANGRYGFDFDRAKARATRIYQTTREILRSADPH